jgi:hypothetical protein
MPPELISLDQLLRTKLKESNFIWDVHLQNEFPENKFWFLYGSL